MIKIVSLGYLEESARSILISNWISIHFYTFLSSQPLISPSHFPQFAFLALIGLVLQILDQFLFHVVENDLNLLMLRRQMSFFTFLPDSYKELYQEVQVGYLIVNESLSLKFETGDSQFQLFQFSSPISNRIDAVVWTNGEIMDRCQAVHRTVAAVSFLVFLTPG